MLKLLKRYPGTTVEFRWCDLNITVYYDSGSEFFKLAAASANGKVQGRTYATAKHLKDNLNAYADKFDNKMNPEYL